MRITCSATQRSQLSSCRAFSRWTSSGAHRPSRILRNGSGCTARRRVATANVAAECYAMRRDATANVAACCNAVDAFANPSCGTRTDTHFNAHMHTCASTNTHARTHTHKHTQTQTRLTQPQTRAQARRSACANWTGSHARLHERDARTHACVHSHTLIAHQSRRPLAPLRSGHGPHVNMPIRDRGLSENMPTRDRGLRGNAPMRDRGLSGSDTIGLKVGGPQARPHTCTDGRAWVRPLAHRGACVGAI